MFTNKGLKYYASEPDDDEDDQDPHLEMIWEDYPEIRGEYGD